jgi:hypothetical protein
MNERDEQERWKALQIELGLTPSDDFSPEPARPERPPAPPIHAESPHGGPSEDDRGDLGPRVEPRAIPDVRTPVERHIPDAGIEEVAFGAGIDLELDDSVEPASVDNVEVGEAPEEVPDPEPETAAEVDKRRRRRRRGRRGRRDRDEARPEEEAVGTGSESPANGLPVEEMAEGEDDSADDSDAEFDDGDDDDEVEPLSFTDWNVPTWNELIASLYRPER